MEFLDILDEDGNLIGKTATRQEAHRLGLWHRVAHIWIINSRDEVLIQKRSANKETYPNLWAMSCEGHISAGQTSMEGALREIKEELGLIPKPENTKLLFSYKRPGKYGENLIDNSLIDVYLVNLDLDLTKLTIQEEELSEIKWIRISDYIEAEKRQDPSFRNYQGELEKVQEILREHE